VALPSPFNVISICSGSGAGDLAIRLAVPGALTRVYVEREAHAAASLVRKMEEGSLAPDAGIWDDVRTFDGKPFSGAVDCIVATYPCQPFSCAGKRQGEADPRHIWPDIARIVGECKPALVFLENVRGHLRLGFERVCRDLQAMGYETRAGLFSSEAVGAPHGRVRLFALAVSKDCQWRAANCGAETGAGANGIGRGIVRESSGGGGLVTRSSGELDNSISERVRIAGAPESGGDRTNDGIPWAPGSRVEDSAWCDGPRSERGLRMRRGSGERSDELADSDRDGFGGLGQPESRSVTQAGCSDLQRPFYFPPYRTGDFDRWADVLVRAPWLRPALAQAEVECLFRRMAPGLAGELEFSRERIDRLRSVGEGVTPIAMAFAFVVLAKAHGIEL